MAHKLLKEKYPNLSIEATQLKRDRERARVAIWRKTNPEKYRAQYLRYQEKNREKVRARCREHFKNNREKYRLYKYKHNLKSVFGITIEEYNALWEKQGKVCAICGKSPEEVGERFHLDHDHTKEQNVRGILCPRCNHGLGHFRDDTELLEKAAKYLKRGALLLTT